MRRVLRGFFIRPRASPDWAVKSGSRGRVCVCVLHLKASEGRRKCFALARDKANGGESTKLNLYRVPAQEKDVELQRDKKR
jgi:hypothetical protein